MQNSSSKQSRGSFSLSNWQVVLILLAVGAVLLPVTWVFAVDIGRVPVSLWDICTTVLSSATELKK